MNILKPFNLSGATEEPNDIKSQSYEEGVILSLPHSLVLHHDVMGT